MGVTPPVARLREILAASRLDAVQVLFADTVQSSWQAVTDGGILVAGATPVTLGNGTAGNLHTIRDAVNAIAAAGGPTLTRQQVALFGGQN